LTLKRPNNNRLLRASSVPESKKNVVKRSESSPVNERYCLIKSTLLLISVN